MNSDFTFTSQFCAQEFVKRLMSKRAQLSRFLMLVEKRALAMLLLTVSTRLPMLSQARRHRTSWKSQLCKSGCSVLETFLKSRLWSGSTQNSQVVTCEVEFHVNSNLSCVSVYFRARYTACPVVGVGHTPVSARLLTHPDVSSTSALSQLQHICKSHQSADSHFNGNFTKAVCGRLWT